ncbi:protein of unknown function [Legionella longbeachae NSW150]|uniref:Uncharacterized protein n=1 Tax=Legionella longbeachae serogroup 1 (strain NSW150) TaxID=661367 RepID=D3HQ56_LEGLN|nr:protein of unknown function [Legionella longbeachae NSW150]
MSAITLPQQSYADQACHKSGVVASPPSSLTMTHHGVSVQPLQTHFILDMRIVL